MRNLPVGNGSLLVTFDELYQIRDVYFPHVGKENHSEGHAFRFGVWVDNEFSWISGNDWERDLRYLPETLVTNVRLRNEKLGVQIVCHDAVDSYETLFLRELNVTNLLSREREIRIFLHHDFYISETEVGDTAFFDPETHGLVHYKANRYFLANSEPSCAMFATGRKGLPDKQGTWQDAQDGWLSGAAITEGAVDSTLGIVLKIDANQTEQAFYWIAAGTSYKEVERLNQLVKDQTASKIINNTRNYWKSWVNKNATDFADLSPEIVDLFKRSLLIIRTQTDDGGAILAANDSDVTSRATDHYSYLWTRDGAFVAHALDLAGYSFLTRSFFELCGKIIHEKGYFLQKYNADGTPASSWHALWDVYEKKRLVPIQEDETALILWALWHHYDKFRDIEFVRQHYFTLIVRAADFMVEFRDDVMKLPLSSWNLWEDRRGVHTFTCATVCGGLNAAANFARLFGETKRAEIYANAALEVKNGIREHLYSASLKRFVRALMPNYHGEYYADTTLDASLFGVFYCDVFDANDEMVVSTMRQIEDRLTAKTEIGGVARFENDGYMSVANESNRIAGNGWYICTLWLAEFHIASAKSIEDLTKAREILEWTAKNALPSGVLAEQIHPLTGEPLSVSPLTWSHSSFVAVVMNYLGKVSSFKFQVSS